MKFSKGIFCIALSAIIFGFTPILTRITYDGGANGVTVTFLRTVMCLPVLFIILKSMRVSMKITRKQFINTIILGFIGLACTTVLLYMSYSYIAVGMATTLHFIYPLIIVLTCVFLFKEKLNRDKILASILVTVGIFAFLEKGMKAEFTGIAIALISGAFYAFYVIFSEKSGLKEIHYFVLAFYVCAAAAVSVFIFGSATGTLTVHLAPKAWIYSFIVSMFTSIGAIPLLQIGLREVGASAAGILSTLEPITSVICGIFILDEKITWIKLIGCILILSGVILTQKSTEKIEVADNKKIEATF